MRTVDLTPLAHLAFEAGTLKNARRTGWWMAGVRDPESVAEHSWRTALLASVLAAMEGADPARAALLAVWHDSQESRTGDVNYLGRKYADRADPEAVTADQVAGLPEAVAESVRGVVAEFEGQGSAEAVCARDADKLECLVQGVEYRARGYADAQRWIDNSYGRLTTASGRELADAVLRTGSLDWLREALGEGEGKS
ncbi:HAD family hydrolase [Streptomyces sp. CLI2509]|nr:HAD family hydrolase [Streptomyces sp. CLI2509]MYX24425.1 HD domain-containing protein [Streptomyces sp. SID8380]